MTRATSALTLFALAAWTSPRATAAQGRAESGFPFDPMQARAIGLGGAGAALRSPPFYYLNPAALADNRGAELDHRTSPLGTRDYAISVGHGGRWGALRITARRRDWGELAQDLGLSGVTAGERSVSLAFARKGFQQRVAWGFSVGRLDADYVGARTGTWSLDLGTQARVGGGLAVGLALLHAGRGFATEAGRAPLPTRIRPGAAWEGQLGKVRLVSAVDVAVPVRTGAGVDMNTGVEVSGTWGSASAASRVGYRSIANPDGSRQGSWALGGGVTLGPLGVDIAYTFGLVFGNERFTSLVVRW